ncbi:MAG: hypothetical protein GY827_06315 [Cytophagales bacterium]|nr:hypothetical protein [Cytophagales bacterium]
MSEDFNTYQLIQDYLRGSLSKEQEEAVLQRASQDAEFNQLLEEEKSLHDLIEGTVQSEIETEVKQAFQKEKNKQNIKSWIPNIGVFIVFVGTVYLLFFLQENIQEYANPPSTKEEKQPSEVQSKDSVSQHTTTQNNIVPTEPKKETRHSNPNNTENPVSVPNTTKDTSRNTQTIIDSTDQVDVNIIKQKDSIPTTNQGIPSNVVGSIVEDAQNPCEKLQAEVSIDKELPCLFGDKGIINVEVEGGQEPYVFQLNSNISEEGNFDELTKGMYVLLVRDANNCIITSQNIELKTKRCQELPLAFDPSFGAWTYETEGELVELKILSRFGKVVFTQSEENPAWEGTNNNGEELPTDDYLFIISKNGIVIDKGNVTIVRQ